VPAAGRSVCRRPAAAAAASAGLKWELELTWKIRNNAIVENVVAYVYAKFRDDRLWSEKALADRKSDNNNNIKNSNKNKNNVGGAWRPVSGSKDLLDHARKENQYHIFCGRT